jgi:hypothetical protein|mmetsp:Transcript_23675/g.40923  ORF Transcript_23675/g.40923 Transcript_23675/m.40923 type:complete len:114 (+) Transcript_23675:169-510(+)
MLAKSQHGLDPNVQDFWEKLGNTVATVSSVATPNPKCSALLLQPTMLHFTPQRPCFFLLLPFSTTISNLQLNLLEKADAICCILGNPVFQQGASVVHAVNVWLAAQQMHTEKG